MFEKDWCLQATAMNHYNFNTVVANILNVNYETLIELSEVQYMGDV